MIFVAEMRSFFISLLTFVLVLTSAFVVLVILMQRPSTNAGMGSALGSGAAESAFGSDTTKVLTKWTVGGIVTFFVVAFILAMSHIGVHHRGAHPKIDINLETIMEGAAATETSAAVNVAAAVAADNLIAADGIVVGTDWEQSGAAMANGGEPSGGEVGGEEPEGK
jgi:preprotein translocase subunit SecG